MSCIDQLYKNRTLAPSIESNNASIYNYFSTLIDLNESNQEISNKNLMHYNQVQNEMQGRYFLLSPDPDY